MPKKQQPEPAPAKTLKESLAENPRGMSLEQTIEKRAESRAKIEAQAKDKKRVARRKAIDRIAARHHGRRSSKEFLREVAAYDRGH